MWIVYVFDVVSLFDVDWGMFENDVVVLVELILIVLVLFIGIY